MITENHTTEQVERWTRGRLMASEARRKGLPYLADALHEQADAELLPPVIGPRRPSYADTMHVADRARRAIDLRLHDAHDLVDTRERMLDLMDPHEAAELRRLL